jgi:hypothetical protein
MEKINYLIIGLMTLNIVYSLYYIISRPLLGVDLYGSWIILYIASAEYTPSLFSFILGALSDVGGGFYCWVLWDLFHYYLFSQ